MSWEYYRFISVEPTAEPDEITRACVRKRHELAVARDEDGAAHLSQVRETLLDPKARAEYDALQEHGSAIAALLEEVEAASAAENWVDAVRLLQRLLQRLLALAPTNAVARNRLGVCFLRSGQYAEAIRLYEALTRDHPEMPLYWLNYGRAYLRLATIAGVAEGAEIVLTCPECRAAQRVARVNRIIQQRCAGCETTFPAYGEDQLPCYIAARERFQYAAQLDPANPDGYTETARTYLDLQQFDEALAWAERAVGVTGETGPRDFDTFYFMAMVHLRRGDWEGAQAVARRLAGILTQQDDREYAAWRFGTFGDELYQAQHFREAVALAGCALVLCPEDGAAQGLRDRAEATALADEEYPTLEEDEQVARPLRRLAALNLVKACQEEVANEEEIITCILRDLDAYPLQQVLKSLQRIASCYPGTYRMRPRAFDDIERIVRDALAEATPAPQPRSSGAA
ncbi:MAG TPA: tetratricopeptide repeat protein [Armatimonadota bacterium]|nr:tetratricopeptide repeat protein [Armatimonadota bacterium]